MIRRNFLGFLGGAVSASGLSAAEPSSVEVSSGPRIALPTFPSPSAYREVALFGFDDRAFPFRNHTEIHLSQGTGKQIVLPPGPPGSYEEVLLYYGTVIKIADTLHMWYNGNYGPFTTNNVNRERAYCKICYATSKDGITWEKPNLGLVDWKGSKQNNLVEFDEPGLWSTFGVIYEPDEPRRDRRYKAAYEARLKPAGPIVFCVAFSPDGFHWKPYENNPVGFILEMTGITKHDGLYYVNGHNEFGSFHRTKARRLATYASADFEHWSPCAALGMDRTPDVMGPSLEDRVNWEEIHLGAGLWSRGNVILGIYGQWHGDPSGDRRRLLMDLGLAVSHDAIHFQEPIPNFRFIACREQPDSPLDVGPALMQGQGMENIGDRTLYWYSLWRGTSGTGVRVASWPRDRMGALKAFLPQDCQAISCPIQIVQGSGKAYLNASGLGENTRLRVSLLDAGFQPIPGYSGGDAAEVTQSGFRIPIAWKKGDAIPPSLGRVRLQIEFAGVRPEDAALHAAYVTAS
jgi:hypothetical protein